MKKRYLNLLRLLFGFSILFVLFYKVGFSKIIKTLATTNIIFIPFAALVYFLGIFIGAINLRMLLRTLELKINILKFFKYFLLSFSIALLTPAKIGNFSLIYFLKKEGFGVGKTLSAFIVDKIMTLIVASLLCLIGVIIFFGTGKIWAILGLITMLLFCLYFVFISNIGRGLIKKYILKEYSLKFKGFSKSLFRFKNHKRILLLNFTLTIIKNLFGASMIYLIFLSFNQNVSILLIYIINSVEYIISLIPVSINGLGIKESAGVFLYLSLGISSPIILSRYVISLSIRYILGFLSIVFIKHELPAKK